MREHHSIPIPFPPPALWAWAQPDLSPCERLTILALVHYADNQGRCCLALGSLALFAGISKRSASSTTTSLRARGLLAIESQARGKHGSNPSRFQVLSPEYDR